MSAPQVLQHNGRTVVVLDLANKTPDEGMALLREAQSYFSVQPPKSIRVLTDVTNVAFNQASLSALREFSETHTPRIAFSAVVGADGLRAVVLQTIHLVTGRQIRPCKDREEALQWLTAHD